MKRALVLAAAVLTLALGACAQTQLPTADPIPAPITHAAATPSPRPECAPANVTLYFTDEVASEQPVVTPLLNDFLARVRGCQDAGGEVRAIRILATADAGLSVGDAREQVRRRQDRVREALVRLGAPADKIVYAEAVQAAEQAVMARRAEVSADLY